MIKKETGISPTEYRSIESGALLKDMDTPEAYQDILAKYKRGS